MSGPRIQYLETIKLPGQFPESDVRGAAAIEAASGRTTYLGWEEERRLQLELQRNQPHRETRAGAQPAQQEQQRQQQQQQQQQQQEEATPPLTDKQIVRRLRRCMRAVETTTGPRSRWEPELVDLMARASDLVREFEETDEVEGGSNAASPPRTEVVHAPSPGPPDDASVSTETLSISPPPAPSRRARVTKRRSTSAARGPVVTRSGRAVKPSRRLRD